VGKSRVFAAVNGSSRYSIVAFSRATGAVDQSWRAHISAVTGLYGGTSANAILVAGRRVYLTGDFNRINRARRNGFAALDQTTARVLPSWQPRAAWVYGSLLARSRNRVLVAIGLARQLRFDFKGLKTYRPVRTLRLTLALSGPGRVRIGLGRGCNTQRWLGSLRCSGHVLRGLAVVRFDRADRKPYVRRLGVPSGRYFIHFVPESPKGIPQTPQDFPITVPPSKVRSTFAG
jgi:hypothetical protein